MEIVAPKSTDARPAATPEGFRGAARGKGIRYPDDIKAKALTMYAADGPAATERAFGIPQGTITRWARLSGVVCISTTKASAEAANTATLTRRLVIREKLLKCVELILDDICIGHEARERKDNAMAAAILLDKFRLEQGEPTGREEVRHDYSNRSDEDLIAEANAITRESAPHP